MMQPANKADLPEITAVWQESFGDTAEEIESFFAAAGKDAEVYIHKEDGKIAGQLVLLPAFVYRKDAMVPAAYIYAVATAKAFRGRGICTGLLKEVCRKLAGEGKAAFLVPAEESLTDFYKKRGFADLFREEKLLITAQAGLNDRGADMQYPVPQAIKPDDYLLLRKKSFEKSIHIELPDEVVRYAVLQKLAEGCVCGCFSLEGKEYGVIYRLPAHPGEPLLIEEITAAGAAEAKKASVCLLHALSCKDGMLKRSYATLGFGPACDFVQKGYFNLVLD